MPSEIIFYPYLFLASTLKLKPVFGPYSIMVDIEDECDLHCRMCYFHSPYIEEEFRPCFTRMEFAVFKDLISDLANIGVRKIILCGKGEPFLHPDIIKMIKLVKENNFILHIFTNGIHIKENMLEEMLTLNVDRLIFSIHAGDYQTYRKVHPAHPDKFEYVEKLLKEIKKYKEKRGIKKPFVKIVNVIYKDNFQDIPEMIQFAERYCDEIMFKPVQLYPSQKGLGLNFQDIEAVVNYLSAYRPKIKNNVRNYISCIRSGDRNKEQGKFLNSSFKIERRKCFLPWYQSVIMTNGDVVLCAYNQIKTDNIYHDAFSSIWFSDKYHQIRRDLPCGRCSGKAVYPFLRWFKSI
jgi:MoaA/NifB/PqqE/SkfB family radical SAM enzyme